MQQPFKTPGKGHHYICEETEIMSALVLPHPHMDDIVMMQRTALLALLDQTKEGESAAQTQAHGRERESQPSPLSMLPSAAVPA